MILINSKKKSKRFLKSIKDFKKRRISLVANNGNEVVNMIDFTANKEK